MNDAAVRARAAASSAPGRGLGRAKMSAVLDHVRSRHSAEDKLDRQLRHWERDRVLAGLRDSANVALSGVNVDPMYMSSGRW